MNFIKEVYDYCGVIFKPTMYKKGLGLKATIGENETREYKKFGKLLHTYNDAFKYQPVEILHQILGFLNTNGGYIIMGVHDDGYLIGGDYQYEDYGILSDFLVETIIALDIKGLGLIEDPKYFKIPAKYVAQPIEKHLAIIKINKSPFPIIENNRICVREISSVHEITHETWKIRQLIQQPADTKKINTKKQPMSYAQIAKAQ
jgi:predicted HTH transcriptional regulator